MSCRDARFKTSEFKDWATRVSCLLKQHSELAKMAELHKANGGEFHVEVIATFPQNMFRNTKGEISSKTIDCSNFEKPLIDVIFGAHMDVNDKHITRLVSSKCADEAYSIRVQLSLVAA